jgi:hypothetical protein
MTTYVLLEFMLHGLFPRSTCVAARSNPPYWSEAVITTVAHSFIRGLDTARSCFVLAFLDPTSSVDTYRPQGMAENCRTEPCFLPTVLAGMTLRSGRDGQRPARYPRYQ